MSSGSLVAEVRAHGGHLVHDSMDGHSDNSRLLDGLSKPQSEKSLGEWGVTGPSNASSYKGRVVLTDQRLLVQRHITAGGWNVETIWQSVISPKTRLEPLVIHTDFGATGGALRGLARGFGIILGLGFLFIPFAIVSLIGTWPRHMLAAPHSPGGVMGSLARVAGIFALLARWFTRSTKPASEVPAVTVLPHPWYRPRAVTRNPQYGGFRVQVKSGAFPSNEQRTEDPIRPFMYRWGIRKPYPPVPAAPLVPVSEEAGVRIAAEVNQTLDQIRSGSLQ